MKIEKDTYGVKCLLKLSLLPGPAVCSPFQKKETV